MAYKIVWDTRAYRELKSINVKDAVRHRKDIYD